MWHVMATLHIKRDEKFIVNDLSGKQFKFSDPASNLKVLL